MRSTYKAFIAKREPANTHAEKTKLAVPIRAKQAYNRIRTVSKKEYKRTHHTHIRTYERSLVVRPVYGTSVAKVRAAVTFQNHWLFAPFAKTSTVQATIRKIEPTSARISAASRKWVGWITSDEPDFEQSKLRGVRRKPIKHVPSKQASTSGTFLRIWTSRQQRLGVTLHSELLRCELVIASNYMLIMPPVAARNESNCKMLLNDADFISKITADKV